MKNGYFKNVRMINSAVRHQFSPCIYERCWSEMRSDGKYRTKLGYIGSKAKRVADYINDEFGDLVTATVHVTDTMNGKQEHVVYRAH